MARKNQEAAIEVIISGYTLAFYNLSELIITISSAAAR